MSVVKKTISIPEDLYKETAEYSKNFSKFVQSALKHFIENKKKEKILSFAGKLSEWEINGLEYVKEQREEDIKTQKERDEFFS